MVIFEENHLDGSLVERRLLGNVQNEVRLDKLAFPEDEGSLFGATQNFSVGQLVIARHVREL